MTCKHEQIQTWRTSDGDPAGLWSCVECGARFEPIGPYLEKIAAITADRDSWAQQASDRAQDALDLVAEERERCINICEQHYSIELIAQQIAAEIRGPNVGIEPQP